MNTRNLIVSSLALVWGGAVILFALLHSEGVRGSGAYQDGQIAGFVVAALLLFAGGRGILIELRKRDS